MRRTRRRELVRVARRRQRDVLCDVMLSARQCETWLTLDELAKLSRITRRQAFPRSCGISASRSAAAMRWRRGLARRAESCAEKTSEQFGSISSSASFAGRSPTRACEVARGNSRSARWLADRRIHFQSRVCGGAMGVKPELAFDVFWKSTAARAKCSKRSAAFPR